MTQTSCYSWPLIVVGKNLVIFVNQTETFEAALNLHHASCDALFWKLNFPLKHLDQQIIYRTVISDDNDLIWQMLASDLHTVKEQGEESPLALEK